MLSCLSIELRSNLDLLPSGKQIADGHTCHSGHLRKIEQAHKLFQESHWQIGVLNTVDSKPPPGKLILALQITDNRVMHIFLLFFKEVSRH
jgi:hypothetical protein